MQDPQTTFATQKASPQSDSARLLEFSVDEPSGYGLIPQFASALNTYAHPVQEEKMKRTDLKIEGGRIIVHPTKVKELKKEARSRISAEGLAGLRDSILDKQLELHFDEIVAAEPAEEMRAEIRSMIAEGVK